MASRVDYSITSYSGIPFNWIHDNKVTFYNTETEIEYSMSMQEFAYAVECIRTSEFETLVNAYNSYVDALESREYLLDSATDNDIDETNNGWLSMLISAFEIADKEHSSWNNFLDAKKLFIDTYGVASYLHATAIFCELNGIARW